MIFVPADYRVYVVPHNHNLVHFRLGERHPFIP